MKTHTILHKLLIKNTSMKLASLFLVAAVGTSSLQPAFASRKSQAQDAKQAAESNLNSVNNEINSIASKQAQLRQEINSLDAELVDLLLNMDILSDDLDQKEQEIKQANEDLKVAKQEEADQYERMKKRIRYMYERGDNSIMEALIGATSMSDFLNKVNYCNAVYDYDRDQLQLYKETKQEVIDLKGRLENEQSEMEEMQNSYKEQEANLKQMVSAKEATMDDFDSQLSQAKVLAAAYKDTIQRQNQIIQDEEEKERQAAEAAAAAERAAQEAAAAAAQRQQEAAANNNAAANSAPAANNSPSNTANSAPANNSQSNTANNTPAANNSPSNTANSAPAANNSGQSSSSNPPANSQPSTPAANSSGVTGSDVVNYASQFIGGPYVWGGTSLTNGADCSGFTMSVYAHFGYSLPHSSYAQANCGRGVSYSEAQPGDLICYGGHVALYIGGGMILGAQSSRSGITTQNATYRTIVAVRRIIN